MVTCRLVTEAAETGGSRTRRGWGDATQRETRRESRETKSVETSMVKGNKRT